MLFLGPLLVCNHFAIADPSEERSATAGSHPMKSSPRMQSAIGLEEAGKYDEALSEFRAMTGMDPRNPFPWLKIGLIERLVMGRNREALAAFQRVVELDPTNDAAWYYLGLTAGDLASYPAAIAALEETMRRQPPDHPVGRDYLELYCAVLELTDHRPDHARRRLAILRSVNPAFAKTLEALLAQTDE